MCLKGSDFFTPIFVKSAVPPAELNKRKPVEQNPSEFAYVNVEAFPLDGDRDGKQLLQLAGAGLGIETPNESNAAPVCRGQVNSSNVAGYLNEILELCHEVERILTASFKVWKAEKKIPDLNEISDDVFWHGISMGSVVRCFDGAPPAPIVKKSEVIAVRIERKLVGRLNEFKSLDWFMSQISQTIRKTFARAKRSDVIVIFYNSIFSFDPTKRKNDLMFVDLNIQSDEISDEKKALVSHLNEFFGPDTVSKAVQPLGIRNMHKISGTQQEFMPADLLKDSLFEKKGFFNYFRNLLDWETKFQLFKPIDSPIVGKIIGTQHQWRVAAAISAAMFIISAIGVAWVLVLSVRFIGDTNSIVVLLFSLFVFSLGLLISHALTLAIDENYGIENL